MKISKERFEALTKKGRKTAKAAASGIKGTAMQLLAGAGAGLLESQLIRSVPSIANQGWFAPPLTMAVLGYFAARSRRFASVGNALLGAAGYSAQLRYRSMGASASGEAGRLVGAPFRPRIVAPPAAPPAAAEPEAARVRGFRAL